MSTGNRILALAAALGLGAGVGAETLPRLVVPQPIHDFGILRRGESASTTFALENRGEGVLEISEVRGSCACTAAEYDERIAAGATGTVRVELDTSILKGASASRLVVYTNDPASPMVELTVKSEVRHLIVTSPGYARFVVVEGEGASAAHGLWAPDGAELAVDRVESPFPFLEVSFREAADGERQDSGGNRQWRIETRLTAAAPVGPFSGFVKVHLDHPEAELVLIPVSGLVQPKIRIIPAELDFGEVRLEEPLSQRVLITSQASEPIELHRVENPVAGLEAAISALEPGRRFALELTLEPEMASGSFAGELVIHTSLGGHTLPVRGSIE